jgi:hypothetical protein
MMTWRIGSSPRLNPPYEPGMPTRSVRSSFTGDLPDMRPATGPTGWPVESAGVFVGRLVS